MKKIAKVLLTLGVFLMFSAGLWAAPELAFCQMTIFGPGGAHIVLMKVPVEAAEVLEAHGWVCDLCLDGSVPPCPDP